MSLHVRRWGPRNRNVLFNVAARSIFYFYHPSDERSHENISMAATFLPSRRGRFKLSIRMRTAAATAIASRICYMLSLLSIWGPLFRNSAWIYRPAGPNGHFTDEHVSASRTVQLRSKLDRLNSTPRTGFLISVKLTVSGWTETPLRCYVTIRDGILAGNDQGDRPRARPLALRVELRIGAKIDQRTVLSLSGCINRKDSEQ